MHYDFDYARDHDSDSSASCSSNLDSDGESNNDSSESSESGAEPRFMGQKRLPIDDYELFLFGFYYFFFLQDPMINQTLNEPNEFVGLHNVFILQDLKLFN